MSWPGSMPGHSSPGSFRCVSGLRVEQRENGAIVVNPKRVDALARFRFITAFLLLLVGAGVAAAPFVPTDDAQVLERLPTIPAAQLRQLKSLQAGAAQAPTDPARAVALATAYYRASRLEGDPRFLGYAQAALAPWWKDPEAPMGVLLLRATIRQS